MSITKRFKEIAIVASGTGTNAISIIKYLEGHPSIRVKLLLTNKAKSGVPVISEKYEIPYRVFTREDLKNKEAFLDLLTTFEIDFIVLAGFLWLVPEYLVSAFDNRIFNIHPALLPKYGGKGMYGMNIHRAVYESDDKVSGLTIHLVNKHYDEGQVLFQHEVNIENCESADEVGNTILKSEHQFYPEVIERYINNFK